MSEIGRGKYIYGSVKVGERGQIVIPAKAREHFNIKPGDILLVVGHREKGGIGLIKASVLKDLLFKVLESIEETEGSIATEETVKKTGESEGKKSVSKLPEESFKGRID